MNNLTDENILIDKIYVVEKEISQLHKQLENELEKEKKTNAVLNSLKASLEKENNRNERAKITFDIQKNTSTLKSVEKGKARLTNRLAERNRVLSIFKIDLRKIQNLEKKNQEDILKINKQINEELERQKKLKEEIEREAQKRDYKYDFFISYSSDDKEDVAQPLADELKRLGVNVWFDDYNLKVGDRLRKSIDHGLNLSRYGILIISKTFIKKKWTQYEYDSFFTREMSGNDIILPIWHRVTKNEVQEFSLGLGDRVALNTTNYSIENIAKKLYYTFISAENTKTEDNF